MANKGLKYYSNQLELSLGNIAKFSLCLFENNANFFAKIPLLKTFGRLPIDASIIFNLLDMDVNPDFFGYGFYCSYFLHKEDIGLDDTRVFNPDGSKDIYVYDHFVSHDGSHYVWSFKSAAAGGFMAGFAVFLIPGGEALFLLKAFTNGFMSGYNTKLFDLLTDQENHNVFELLFKPLVSGIIDGFLSIMTSKISHYIGKYIPLGNNNDLTREVFDFALKNKISILLAIESAFSYTIKELKTDIMVQYGCDVLLHGTSRLLANENNETIITILGWIL